eukprot:2637037-Prymnesium_polylepis.2
MQRYDQEASNAYMMQAYDVALDRFCHYLALVETDPSTTVVSEMRATLTANIGACLYGLDEPTEALVYLERAAAEVRFRATHRARLSRRMRLLSCVGRAAV